ncbi:MAG: hypothetical protein ACLP5E_14855 [Streptosporangiaceae bacterium]
MNVAAALAGVIVFIAVGLIWAGRLVHLGWGRVSDRVFVTGGTMLVVLGAAMAIIGS